MIDVENESENNFYLILMAVKWLQTSKIYTSIEVPERYVGKLEGGGLNFGKGTWTYYRRHNKKYLILSEAPMILLTEGAKKALWILKRYSYYFGRKFDSSGLPYSKLLVLPLANLA